MAIYQVQSGDSLVSIAQTIYGDPRRWRDVARLLGRDPATFGTEWAIRPGDTIEAPADTPFAQAQTAAAEPAAEPADGYTPQEGDMAGIDFTAVPNEGMRPGATVGAPAAEPAPAPVQLFTPVEMEPVAEPAPAPAPMETGPTAEATAARESVRDIVAQWLATYDLEELSDVVYDMIFKENILDENRIYFRLQEEDAYKRRFAGNIARREAGLNVYSEERYLELENQYRYYRGLAGMPEGFYDSNADIAEFIGNDVSPDEYYARLNEGYIAVTQADPEVVAELQRLYNVTDSDLAQFFLDPERTRTRLAQQAQTALIAGEARQEGLQLSLSEAEMLQRQGIDPLQAQQGFQAIQQGQEVFRATTEEAAAGEEAFTQSEQIGAVFGTDAAAAQRLRQRARRRQAAFETGGRFAGQGAEVTGLR